MALWRKHKWLGLQNKDVDTLCNAVEEEPNAIAIDLKNVVLIDREAVKFLGQRELNGTVPGESSRSPGNPSVSITLAKGSQIRNLFAGRASRQGPHRWLTLPKRRGGPFQGEPLTLSVEPCAFG
jgi:hypothetical protein